MNRRNFIGAALRAAAGFAILPSATTYVRAWKPTPAGLVTPRWIPTPPEAWDKGVFRASQNPIMWYWCKTQFAKDFAAMDVETSLMTPFYLDYLRAASPAT